MWFLFLYIYFYLGYGLPSILATIDEIEESNKNTFRCKVKREERNLAAEAKRC